MKKVRCLVCHFMGKRAKIQLQVCLVKFFWYKFKSETFKPIYERRKLMFLWIFESFKAAINRVCKSQKRGWVCKLQNPYIATFVEGLQF